MKHHIDDNVLNEQLKTHLRALKMPGLSRKLDEVVRHAEAERAGYRQFLVDALSTERLSREDSAINTRIREAGFPEHKTLAEFDFNASDGIDPAVVGQLATGVFVDNAENLALIGPVGTGKTHLGIAIGIEMCRRRKHVRFVRPADLVRQLLEARDQRELGRLTQRLQRADLLIVDELGFVPFDRQGGGPAGPDGGDGHRHHHSRKELPEAASRKRRSGGVESINPVGQISSGDPGQISSGTSNSAAPRPNSIDYSNSWAEPKSLKCPRAGERRRRAHALQVQRISHPVRFAWPGLSLDLFVACSHTRCAVRSFHTFIYPAPIGRLTNGF